MPHKKRPSSHHSQRAQLWFRLLSHIPCWCPCQLGPQHINHRSCRWRQTQLTTIVLPCAPGQLRCSCHWRAPSHAQKWSCSCLIDIDFPMSSFCAGPFSSLFHRFFPPIWDPRFFAFAASQHRVGWRDNYLIATHLACACQSAQLK